MMKPHGHTPADEQERRALADIEKHGCHVLLVGEEPGCPLFAYSVGVQHDCGAPEVVVYGLPDDLAHELINCYHRRVRAGERFEPGVRYAEFLEAGYEVMFAPVLNEHYAEHFGWARWFYRGDGFRVLQMIWPTTQQQLPCDRDAPPGFRTRQVTLFRCACAPSHHPRPAPQAADTRAVLCEHVLDNSRPVLLVMHDAQGDWQILCGGTDHTEPRFAHLEHLVERDQSLEEVLDLAIGHEAEREAMGMPWRRRKSDP